MGGLLLAAVRENWRRLRTMRTALWLLGVLAVESIIATIVPQQVNVPQTVADWRSGEAGPGVVVSDAIDLIGAYDMYASPLFLMTLVLLFTSLTACLLPRIRAWWRITRTSVPPLTRHLGDQEHVVAVASDLGEDEARATVRGTLGDRGWRTREGTAADGTTQLAAEKGLALREGGSLLFHLSFYVLLVAIVIGQLTTFEGFVGVTEGETFTDTQIGYWVAEPGRWFGPEDHSGFQITNDEFRVEWFRDPEFGGTPRVFEADLTITDAAGDVRSATVAGNSPVVVDGFKVHLLGWGYAPRVIVREGQDVVYDGYVTTTVNNDTGAFRGAVKAPGAAPDVGLDLFLVPFAPEGDDGQPTITGAPWADAPLLAFRSYTGDLQLSAAQNVNTLNTDLLTEGPRGGLRPGQVVELPGDVSVEFAELRRWTNFQVSRRPQVPWLLLGSALLLGGLVPALYAYRRRLWVGVARSDDGRTLVTVAGRSFQRQEAFAEEFDELAGDLRHLLEAPDHTLTRHDEVVPR